MGFPTNQQLASAARVPVYDPRRGLSHLQARQALGNSQVVPQIGCVVACALACVSYDDAQACDDDSMMGLEGA